MVREGMCGCLLCLSLARCGGSDSVVDIFAKMAAVIPPTTCTHFQHDCCSSDQEVSVLSPPVMAELCPYKIPMISPNPWYFRMHLYLELGPFGS